MYRSESQRNRVCSALLETSFLRGLWTPHGPTERAIELRDTGGADLSSGERVLLLAVWDLWSGEGRLPLSELLGLGSIQLHAIGELISALGSGGAEVERWLGRWERRS